MTFWPKNYCSRGVLRVIALAPLLFVANDVCAADSVQALYESAKKEGKVVLWSALDVSLHKRLQLGSTKSFPASRSRLLNFFRGRRSSG